MTNIRFQSRLRQVRKALQDNFSRTSGCPAALLISSSVPRYCSRDLDHQFRQNSDFLFLTGSSVQDAALIVSSESSRPLLIATSRNRSKIVWDGKGENLRTLANELGAEFIESQSIENEIIRRLHGIETLVFSTEPDSAALKIARKIFELPSHQRLKLPARFAHSDLLLQPLRLHKDALEIKAIESANKVTNTALLCTLPLVKSGRSESALAATIDYSFRLQNAEPGFSSIVAAGSNAATLHHKPGLKKLKKGELILFDIGARLNHYCADISRVVPVSGFFSEVQRDIYQIVLEAQLSAISKVRAGVTAKSVYDAAARVLCSGLKDLGALKGSTSRIFSNQLFKPYFPHSIGHTLGLDVHDIGNIRADPGIRLEKGMVITIEPGLYFQKAIGKIPACGIRIEDNLLVTEKGCRVLSAGFPKKISEIEAFAS